MEEAGRQEEGFNGKSEERKSGAIWGESTSGRRNCKGKSFEAGVGLECSGNSKRPGLIVAEWVWERVVGYEVREAISLLGLRTQGRNLGLYFEWDGKNDFPLAGFEYGGDVTWLWLYKPTLTALLVITWKYCCLYHFPVVLLTTFSGFTTVDASFNCIGWWK